MQRLGHCIYWEEAEQTERWKEVVVAHLEGYSQAEIWLIRSTFDIELLDLDEGLFVTVRDGYLVFDLVGQELSGEQLASRFGCPSSEFWVGMD